MAAFKAVTLKGHRDIKADGTVNIKIRVTHKGKQVYIPTEIYILPNNMDTKTGLCKTGQNKDFINLRITSIITN